jgi:hypothetical protein
MLAHNHVWGIFLKEVSPQVEREVCKTIYPKFLRGWCIILTSRQIWMVKIFLPRSVVEVSFWSPLIILPLTEGWGGSMELGAHLSMVKIGVPISVTFKQFWTPFAILPLIMGGGGGGSGMEWYCHGAPFYCVTFYAIFSPTICSPLVCMMWPTSFHSSSSSDICPLPSTSSSPNLHSCTIMCPSLCTSLHALPIRPFSRSRWHHEKTSTSQRAELTGASPNPKEVVIEVVGGG